MIMIGDSEDSNSNCKEGDGNGCEDDRAGVFDDE